MVKLNTWFLNTLTCKIALRILVFKLTIYLIVFMNR